ncbi:uncharacterized protein LOC127724139 [Mytilus californianus]|uniref:uncharacterized protein LOC127724139 n=1 Tax=Mytilus californianus TaxID=6549 RepID=UPI0022486290|nr:uncharacterized protein LOC127724139 [Mytilus californianus]
MAVGGKDSDCIEFIRDLRQNLPLIHVPGKDEELRIVLVGKIGVGKSSTGNMILGYNGFKAKRKSKSVTKNTKSNRTTISNRSILVIDTPGLYATTKENNRQNVRDEIKTCTQIGAPGIHAIIFVLSAATRFTEEDKNCFQNFFEIFGEKFYQYAVVVFTGADILKEEKTTLKKYIGSDTILKSFLQQCGDRVVAFDNKNPSPLEKEGQRNHLVSIVLQINESLKKYYTNKNFEDAERRLREDAERRLREDAERRLREDVERRHREDIERRLREDAEWKLLEMEARQTDQIEDIHNLYEEQNALEMVELDMMYHENIIGLRDKIRQEIEEENKQKKISNLIEMRDKIRQEIEEENKQEKISKKTERCTVM